MQTDENDLDLLRDESPESTDPESSSSLEAEIDALDRAHLRQLLADLAQDRRERKKYGTLLYWLVVGWLIIAVALVFASGFKWGYVDLPEAVLLALLGTTTTSVIGLFTIVATYLFPRRR